MASGVGVGVRCCSWRKGLVRCRGLAMGFVLLPDRCLGLAYGFGIGFGVDVCLGVLVWRRGLDRRWVLVSSGALLFWWFCSVGSISFEGRCINDVSAVGYS